MGHRADERLRSFHTAHLFFLKGDFEQAKRWLLGAMDIAFLNDFTALFASIITDLGGLLERCMKQAYPEYYDNVIA